MNHAGTILHLMNVLLLIFGFILGFGGLIFSPQGYVGLGLLVCGAIFFSAGAIITALNAIGDKIDGIARTRNEPPFLARR
jgi:hypothetical protein